VIASPAIGDPVRASVGATEPRTWPGPLRKTGGSVSRNVQFFIRGQDRMKENCPPGVNTNTNHRWPVDPGQMASCGPQGANDIWPPVVELLSVVVSKARLLGVV
jgi:hypothetical protein